MLAAPLCAPLPTSSIGPTHHAVDNPPTDGEKQMILDVKPVTQNRLKTWLLVESTM